MYVLKPGTSPRGRTRSAGPRCTGRVCELALVLYRRQDGTAVALEDRCAHRAYPLSAGQVKGDSIECGYHGFAYGPDGGCTRVPAQSLIPKRAKVAGLPVGGEGRLDLGVDR